jgi:coiled-coil-helix-coiled-coil-helix domain-containing protein 10
MELDPFGVYLSCNESINSKRTHDYYIHDISQRGSRGGGGGARRPAAAVPARRPATNTTPAPMQAPASSGGGMMSGIGSTIMQGMAFGTGSAIAHRAVGAVAGSMGGGGGSSDPQVDMANQQQMQPMMQQQQQLSGACGEDKQMFFECLQMNRGDQQSCSFLYDQLQMCKRNQTEFGA